MSWDNIAGLIYMLIAFIFCCLTTRDMRTGNYSFSESIAVGVFLGFMWPYFFLGLLISWDEKKRKKD